MSPAATGSPPTNGEARTAGDGRASGECTELGRLETNDRANLSDVKQSIATVLPFRRPRQPRCSACGQNLPWKSEATICEKHFAEDLLLRSMSLRRQALGMLARAGGI